MGRRVLCEAVARASDQDLMGCCPNKAWVQEVRSAVGSARDDEALLAAARDVFMRLDAGQWRATFATHPKIGDRGSDRESREQSGMLSATDGVRLAMRQMNEEYERKFGFIFLICASGKTAEEMLAAIRQRVRNSPDEEVRVAALEQTAITALRLKALVDRPKL